MLNVIFDLHFGGNKADCNICVLMPQSPIVSKLETTWQSSKQFCFGTFLSIYVQWKWNKWQISAFLEQYLWNIHTVARMWQLHVGKSNTWQKGESDQISLYHMENLCCSRGLIVLNSELKTCAIQKRWFFFWTVSSSCLNSWTFFWTDNPNHLNGIPNDLPINHSYRMTKSKSMIFSCLNKYTLVYSVVMWEVW